MRLMHSLLFELNLKIRPEEELLKYLGISKIAPITIITLYRDYFGVTCMSFNLLIEISVPLI